MPFKSKYTLDDKMQVCNYYVVEGGNSKSVSKKTGVPPQTIRDWTKKEWWHEMVAEIRKRHQDRLDGKFTYVISKLMKEVEDRVVHGDEIMWAKDGTMRRRKMSGKDVIYALTNIIDKRALLRGDPTTRSASVTIDKRMQSVQQRLEEQAKEMKKKIKESQNVEELRELDEVVGSHD